ncbi:Adipocyte plasma membrane-associated protein [Aphelenchoides fujianensis]|nr:Adipocyte plasma membrane-associated protein [Aphelenchoides fujianensis]
MGFVRNLFTILFAGSGILLWQLASDFDARSYDLPPPPALVGPLAPNKLLRNAKLLLKNQILGPESILVEGDVLYTGTWDGKIVKVRGGKIEKTLRLVDPAAECATYDTEPQCGRPLGIRRLNKDLLVARPLEGDAMSNRFLLLPGTSKLVFSSKTKVGGYESKFLNDLDVIDEDTILVTDSSTNYDRRRFLHVLFEQAPVGRVLEVKISSGKARILLGGLYFANGIQLHPDKKSVIVSECSMSRILRLYISGPRAGESEVFASNLPGFPDNIRLSTQGTFYVGLASPRYEGKLSLFDKLGPFPWVRKLLASALPEKYLGQIFALVKSSYGLVLEMDTNGKIIGSYHDPEGQVIADVSQVSDDKDHLYLGSFHSNFIAQVPKKK